MSSKSESLRLLVIDESHAIAESLADILKAQGVPTKVQVLDDQEELEKALRHTWDMVLFVAGYDLKYTDVLRLIKSNDLDLPLFLALDGLSAFDAAAPEDPNGMLLQAYAAGATDVLPLKHPLQLVHRMRHELRNLDHRRNQRNLELMLGDAERRSQLLLKHSRSAVSYIDAGVHIYANESYLELFGYKSIDELMGMPVIDLVDSKDLQQFKDFLKVYTKNGRNVDDFNFSGVRADGTRFEAMLQIGPASYEGEPCIQVIIQHQSTGDTQLLEAQLAAVGRQDVLTGLGNRLAFEEALEDTRTAAIKSKQQQALLFVSIDNIGQINASAGIVGSDATVLKVADSLKAQFSTAQNFRFGDSTFAVLVPNTSAESISAYAQATVEMIAKSLITVGNRTVQTSVSIGIAMIGETSPDSAEILSRAFNAADKVKLQSQGVGNGINLYNPVDDATTSDQALREILEEALEKGNFKLMFQSVYDTGIDTTPMFEVFARLPLADGKVLTPDEFMPAAHRYGMESRLDRWILLNACKRLKPLLAAHPKTRLLVNLSCDSLQDSSLPVLVGKLASAIGTPDHKALILQFNESDAINYLTLARTNIHQFRANGCQVSINNFGASLNAMSLLDHLEIDLVKVDRSFVQDLSNEENVQATKNMTAEIMTHNAQVMIAYIENPTAMSKAWSMGARYLQGYYLQMPSEEMVFE